MRVDFADAPADASGRKRKSKSIVTIKGRKENVNEARKRISNHADRLVRRKSITVWLT